MDRWFILQTKHSVQRLARHGIDAPFLSAFLGLLQFGILIGLFVKIWLIQNHHMSGSMIATLTLIIVFYLVDTGKSVKPQLTAFRAMLRSRTRKDYMRQVRETRKGEAFSRLLTLGLAIGAVSAVPEMLEHFGAPAFYETSGMIAFFVADAIRQYCACIVPVA